MQTSSQSVSGRMPVVYCIGDSHVCFFSGQDTIHPLWPHETDDRLPWFKTYRIGASLAYNLAHEGTKTRGRERLFEVLATNVPAGAHVLLSFGEVDCRVHLVRQAQIQGRPLAEVVESCLESYFKGVREVVALGYRVIVYNAVATQTLPPKSGVLKDGEFVAFGSGQERNLATRLFNEGSRRRCLECGAQFLENSDVIIDKNLKTIRWYFWDDIYLSQRAMPQTLERLRAQCPELGIPVQIVHYPGQWERFSDVVARRVSKKIRKFSRFFGRVT